MKTTDLVQLAHFATGETGVQERTQGGPVRGRQSKALQLSAQVPPRLHSLPGSSVWSGGGLLPLLVAPGQALLLSWPLPGPSELSKLNYGVSQGREVTGCWVCGAEAGGRQEP